MPKLRRPLIAGNWKMNKTAAEARAFIADLRARTLPLDDVDALLCPPFTALSAAQDALAGSRIALGAQNMSWAGSGAFTGEISHGMLTEFGVTYVLLGHSERRAMFGEIDERVNEKVEKALEHGLIPIVAVGETAQEHAAGIAVRRVRDQVTVAFAGIPLEGVAKCIVAYEPIWAIGTGTADSPHDANALMGEIRNCSPALADVRLLYGGSMKPDNVAAFLAQPNIDGGLVGGASLDPSHFAALLDGARQGAA